VVISAHEHFYERFAPQTPDGVTDRQFGLRQFIVGTGGAPLTQPVRRVPNSEATVLAFGLLRLTLDTQSYRWDFLSVDGGAVVDSGTGTCHGRP
jgi:acid phosphatase type 7